MCRRGVLPRLGAIILFVPSFLFIGMGLIHFSNGRTIDAAFPVPLYLSMNIPVPKSAYVDAAELLRNTNVGDGDTLISLSQADWYLHTGKPIDELENGLAMSPASAEGWSVFAEILSLREPQLAGRALETSLILAPYDYFWESRRIALAPILWASLNREMRSEVEQQVRLLWRDPASRDDLSPLLRSAQGREIIEHAFISDPATIGQIVQWELKRRLRIQSGGH
jgi:hypothetical protein